MVAAWRRRCGGVSVSGGGGGAQCNGGSAVAAAGGSSAVAATVAAAPHRDVGSSLAVARRWRQRGSETARRRRKSHQRQQGGNRALWDGRQAFLPVVDEYIADLFRRDRPRHLLVEVDVFFIRATAASSNTDTANDATADDAINAPLAKEATTGGDVAGDPSSTPV